MITKQTPFGKFPFPGEEKIELSIPKIPLLLFWQIASWQKEIVREHSCESTTSLFLIDNQWIAVPFFQENTSGSMTCDVDYTDERNAELLAKYADRSPVHGSIHNHVSAGAGQSGRDEKDETGLPGPHITIGTMMKPTVDWDARFSLLDPDTKQHQFIKLEVTDIIDCVPQNRYTPEQRKAVEEIAKKYALTLPATGYPEEWKKRFTLKKPVVTNHRWSPASQSWTSHQKKTTPTRPASAATIAEAKPVPEKAKQYLRGKLSLKTLTRFEKSATKILESYDTETKVVLAQAIASAKTIPQLYFQLKP